MTLIKCPICNETISDTTCPKCGYALQTKAEESASYPTQGAKELFSSTSEVQNPPTDIVRTASKPWPILGIAFGIIALLIIATLLVIKLTTPESIASKATLTSARNVRDVCKDYLDGKLTTKSFKSTALPILIHASLDTNYAIYYTQVEMENDKQKFADHQIAQCIQDLNYKVNYGSFSEFDLSDYSIEELYHTLTTLIEKYE